MNGEYLTPGEAAKFLGVHPQSLRRWEKEGKITTFRTPGGQRRFHKEEIEEVAGKRRTNATILNDNLNILANDIQRLNLFQKLEADSTLRGKSCVPFWNELCSAIFSRLSLPTLTDSADLDLNWLGGYAKRMDVHSWFSITANSVQSKSWLPICCPSSTVSLLGFTDSENIALLLDKSYGLNPYKKSQNVPPNSVVKIPIFPCKELHLIWKQWLAH